MASSSRSQRELIDLVNANIDMPAHELKDLINAGSTPVSQEEYDKLMNTVVHFDLDDAVDRINKAKMRGDNTVVLNLFPVPCTTDACFKRNEPCTTNARVKRNEPCTTNARVKRNARSKKTCSGPTNR